MVDFIIKYVRVNATQLKINFVRSLGRMRSTWQMGVGCFFFFSYPRSLMEEQFWWIPLSILSVGNAYSQGIPKHNILGKLLNKDIAYQAWSHSNTDHVEEKQ